MSGSADSALHVLGVDLDANDASAQHDQGIEVVTQDGRAIYAKAAANAGATVSGIATLQSTGTINTAGVWAVAQASVSSGNFGWFYTEGRRDCVLRVAAACQPNVPLYTTGTAGVVDDATVSTAGLMNLRILTSASAASAPAAVFHDITNARNYVA
jgi:hypothetical protein